MKTKLLKKIRNRFSIEFYPNGKYIFQRFEERPIIFFEDKGNKWNSFWWYVGVLYTKEEAYGLAYKKLKDTIQKEYSHLRSRKKKNINSVSLWWKKE